MPSTSPWKTSLAFGAAGMGASSLTGMVVGLSLDLDPEACARVAFHLGVCLAVAGAVVGYLVERRRLLPPRGPDVSRRR